MKKINLPEAAAKIEALWSPRVVGQVGDTFVKVARIQGEFLWHTHEDEDEMFIVLKGNLCIKFRDHEVWLEQGDSLLIPRGTEHFPVAPEEVHILLIEPTSTVNTGQVEDERTQKEYIFYRE